MTVQAHRAFMSDPAGMGYLQAMLLPLLALCLQDPAPTVTPRYLPGREGAGLSLPSEEPVFQFAVFGDRTGGPDEGVKILAQAVDEVNLVQPDLVMTVGDLIQGYNTTEPWLAQMTEFRAIMDKLLCPWFPVAGNHDVYWRGPDRPALEHETNYEEHFGPLWYAFRHKHCWFLVLYTDEGNPETGERNFNKPESQRMSPEQFAWLDQTLKGTGEADHVFVFLHHPRWIGRGYGDDWERVHQRLADAGNVDAVFAGHVHRMRYDGPRDGIEYFTLATVGGHQSGLVPEAGFLHHYYLVTVRAGGISVGSYPVGSAQDPRRITGEVSNHCAALAENLIPQVAGVVPFVPSRGASGETTLTWTNPLPRPVEITWSAAPGDRRWQILPEHVHGKVEPGATWTQAFRVLRGAGAVDAAFQVPALEIGADYLGEDLRVTLPVQRMDWPLDISAMPAPAPVEGEERVLALDGESGCLKIPSDQVQLPDGPLTIEAWMRADEFGQRVGLATKTESSEYGIFVSGGQAGFSIHLDGAYAEVQSAPGALVVDRWQHVAGVFDGSELRLYVDGALVASRPASGVRTLNRLPLVVGGDVGRSGGAGSLFAGEIDEFRLSTVARYAGERVEVPRRLTDDAKTTVLMHFDGQVGSWVFGSGLGWLGLEPGAGVGVTAGR